MNPLMPTTTLECIGGPLDGLTFYSRGGERIKVSRWSASGEYVLDTWASRLAETQANRLESVGYYEPQGADCVWVQPEAWQEER